MTDYHNQVTIDTPRVELDKLNIGPIYLNAIRCHTCGEVIRSMNRHDFRWCSCGSVAVDGGSWYLKRSGDLNNYTELSENFYE